MKGGKISMRFQGDFETFKFVDHGGKIQSVMDYIEGESIFYKIQNSVQFSKAQLLKWLNELCMQLEYYHKYKHHAYQYLNPYTIIVTKDQQIRLLNMDSKENEDILIYIQKAVIKNLFYYQSNSKRNKIYTDYYSLGKLLQFLLSSGDFTPCLKIRETRIFSKIIQKCLSNDSENQFQNMKQLQNKFPKVKEVPQKNNKELWKQRIKPKKLIFMILSIVIIGEIGYLSSRRLFTSDQNKIENRSNGDASINESIDEKEQRVLLESGMVMLAVSENLELSGELFEQISETDSLGEDYGKLVAYYRGELSLTEEDIQTLLQKLEKQGKNAIENKAIYHIHMLNIIRGYHKLHTEESNKLLINSMEEYMNLEEVANDNSQYIQEMLGYLLQANIQIEEWGEAQKIIEIMK